MRMLHIHGTSDPVVGYDGASIYFGYQLGLSVDNILNYWKNANGCDGELQIDTLPDLHNDGLQFVRYTYDCGTDLQHIKVIGGNHTWYNNENQYDISYMNEIYDFFIGKSTMTGVVDQPKENRLRVYPNPTFGQVSVEVEEETSIKVMDLQGRVMATIKLTKGINSIDLVDLPEGMYFLKSENGSVGKVLKNR